MASGFYPRNGCWFVDGVPLSAVADVYSTPCYVYSQAALLDSYHQFHTVFSHSRPRICYAVKTNDNISLLALLATAGAGFDIVSGGELAKVLAAGGTAKSVVFSGIGKSVAEIDAALDAGIGCFNVESEQELTRIETRAAHKQKIAPVAFRLTFDIDGNTHRHLTTGKSGGKFGVAPETGITLAMRTAASPHLRYLGYSCHLGSQINDEDTYLAQAKAMAEAVRRTEAQGIKVSHVDLGGGFAVADDASVQAPLSLPRYDKFLAETFAGHEILLEPGRRISAAAGVLLTRVEYTKQSGGKMIWIVDAGMTELLRPALYGANHPVVAVIAGDSAAVDGDVVGPVCENADIIASAQTLSAAAGDLLAVLNAGAYGMVMASNYNARPRPGAVLVADGEMRQIRRPETIAELLAGER